MPAGIPAAPETFIPAPMPVVPAGNCRVVLPAAAVAEVDTVTDAPGSPFSTVSHGLQQFLERRRRAVGGQLQVQARLLPPAPEEAANKGAARWRPMGR